MVADLVDTLQVGIDYPVETDRTCRSRHNQEQRLESADQISDPAQSAWTAVVGRQEIHRMWDLERWLSLLHPAMVQRFVRSAVMVAELLHRARLVDP